MRGILQSVQVTTGTGTKTILELTAPANRTVKPYQVEISFEGVVAADKPIEVDFMRTTASGTGTSRTPVEALGLNGGSLNSTGKDNFTAEPTAGDILRRWFIHPQGGGLIFTVPEPDKWEAGEAGRLAIRCVQTSGTSINCVACIEFEE